MSAQTIAVKGPDGAAAELAAGTTARAALEALGAIKGQVVAAKVDGHPVDLARAVDDGATVEPVTADSDDGRFIIRHSAAHVMAQAVTDLFPGAKYAIGPPIDDGFYYDFEVPTPFTPDDLERIAARMAEIVKEDQPFQRLEVPREEALATLGDQPFKVEILTDGEAARADSTSGGVQDERVSLYANLKPDGGRWVDLCRGPHVPTTRWIPAFALQRSAGAYWRGDEHRPMLQRIYGTAWESRKALKAYEVRLEEARKRDHRKLARELDLLSFPDELGPGLHVWHPKGAIVRQEMEDYIRAEVRRRGYLPVYTPHLAKSTLFETSGHLGFYADGMYPPMRFERDGEGADYYAKPMNCPFHVLIYRSRTRSYRELPVRLAELGTVYRHERSGTVHGLLRARGFTQDDSHIFCTAEQLVEEVKGCTTFAIDLYAAFGFVEGPSRIALSTRPAKAETVGTDDGWAHAEAALHQALQELGLDYEVDEGGGAFYGPKIDLYITDAIGRAWQLTTVQVDFNHPQRFGLTYAGADGAEHQPLMVHRALYGSIDRFFAILVEHYAGAFPTWIAPVQAAVVPVADRHEPYAEEIAAALAADGRRVEVDASDDSMGAKIRRHQLERVPYQLIVGDAEVEAGTVAVRPRYGDQRKAVPRETFAAELAAEVAAKGVGPQP